MSLMFDLGSETWYVKSKKEPIVLTRSQKVLPDDTKNSQNIPENAKNKRIS